MDSIAASIVKRAAQLKSARAVNESTWSECFDFSYPLRGSGFSTQVLDVQSAKSKVSQLLDSTSTDSVRILASALMSGMTPANAQWLDLGEDGMLDDERTWFSTVAKILWENIHSANFDSEGYESNLDVVIAGWFALYIDESRDDGGYNFVQWPIGQCYVASTRADGVVDTIFRCYQLTAEQAVAEFGENSVSDATRQKARDKPDEKVEFIHAIYPRTEYRDDAKLARNMRFASYNVEVTGKTIARESGYHEFPVAVPRWMRIPGSFYGIGPMYDALPDIKELNEIKRQEKAAGDLAIAGMWIAEDDGVLNPRTVTVGPRKIIVANSVDSMKPLLTGADFNVAFTSEQRLQASIRKVLMADQLQPQDGPAMTATEVHVRVALIRQLLGPIYGRLQAEYLQPLVVRCFGLALRAGILPPMPDSLGGRKLNIRYISPLARAQKLEDVTAIERLGANIANLTQINPEVVDLVDTDEAVRVVSDALGVPAKVLRNSADVTALRDQRAQAQQAAQQQQMMQQLGQEAGSAMIQQVVGGGQ